MHLSTLPSALHEVWRGPSRSQGAARRENSNPSPSPRPVARARARRQQRRAVAGGGAWKPHITTCAVVWRRSGRTRRQVATAVFVKEPAGRQMTRGKGPTAPCAQTYPQSRPPLQWRTQHILDLGRAPLARSNTTMSAALILAFLAACASTKRIEASSEPGAQSAVPVSQGLTTGFKPPGERPTQPSWPRAPPRPPVNRKCQEEG